VYHYAGNNPVKYTDPNGNYLINNVAQEARNAREFAQRSESRFDISSNYFGGFTGAFVFVPEYTTTVRPTPVTNDNLTNLRRIELPNDMNRSLATAIASKKNETSPIKGRITADAVPMENGRYEIQVTVSISGFRDKTETIAFAGAEEIMTDETIDQSKVDKIANDTINITLRQNKNTQNID